MKIAKIDIGKTLCAEKESGQANAMINTFVVRRKNLVCKFLMHIKDIKVIKYSLVGIAESAEVKFHLETWQIT